MAVAAKIGKLVSGGWGADLRRVLVPLLFLALVTCHTSRLFGEPFSHIPVATAPVTNALTSGPFALTAASVVPQSRVGWSGARASSPHRMRPGWPRSQGYEPETEGLPASHPAHGVPAGATAGCTNGGRCPIPAKAATSDSYALFSSSATPSQALGLGLCSDGAAYADLWLACLLNAPANAPRRINHSWSSGQTAGAVWAARFSPSSGNVAFDASANRDFSPRVGKSGASEAAEKVPTAVILSEAKDLHLLIFKEILQMLRGAEHDR